MTLLDKIRNTTAAYLLGGLLVISCGGEINNQQKYGCQVSTNCKGDRVCYQGECVAPEKLENLITEDVTENVSNVQPHDPGCYNNYVLYDDFTNFNTIDQLWEINQTRYQEDEGINLNYSFSETGLLLTNGCLMSKEKLNLNLDERYSI